MNKELAVKQSAWLNASPEAVWNVLTDPGQIKKYFYGTDTISDWKVGSSIEFSGEWEGQEYVDKGIILELIPERKLVYNYWSSVGGTQDIPENYGLITYLLTPQNNGTLLEISQQGFENEEKRDHSVEGWKNVIESMKQIIQTETLA